jgi:hypothetical protein
MTIPYPEHIDTFMAELEEAVQTNTLDGFFARWIQRDPARYYVHNGEYCGYNVQLGGYVVVVQEEDADIIENWNGEYINTLPEHIHKALYQYGLQAFDLDSIDPEDIIPW